ncbi:MAG: dUTP diphosphatase [Gammaproteobacteria bacterium]
MDDDDLMIEKTLVMLDMQDEMNCHVDADWMSRGREWYRAIWIECAELMDHYGGWKWWKHAAPDLEQAMLELVDIWHFGLSLRLVAGGTRRDIAAALVAEWNAPPATRGFLVEVESLAVAALDGRRFAVGSVANLVAACGRGFDDLHRTYVAKNVLNVFRQDHGYRSGSYVKTWDGREDNVVLAELLGTLDSDAVDFRERVYAALERVYVTLER